jgi:hypothetical protein
MMVLHCITIVKFIGVCPDIVLDNGLVAHVKLQFRDLHAHLTRILTIFFLWGYLKTQVLSQYS